MPGKAQVTTTKTPPQKSSNGQKKSTISWELGPAIPLSAVRFKSTTAVPGNRAAENVRTQVGGRPTHWSMEYYPTLRSYKVYYDNPSTGKIETGWVDASAVQGWNQLEE